MSISAMSFRIKYNIITAYFSLCRSVSVVLKLFVSFPTVEGREYSRPTCPTQHAKKWSQNISNFTLSDVLVYATSLFMIHYAFIMNHLTLWTLLTYYTDTTYLRVPWLQYNALYGICGVDWRQYRHLV